MTEVSVASSAATLQAQQTPIHREQQLGRRNLLGALVAAPAALSPTPTITADQDPHIEWWHERARLVAELASMDDDVDDDVRRPLLDPTWAIEDRIADTPAATLEGLRLPALAGLLPLEEDFADSEHPQSEMGRCRPSRW